MTCSTMKIGLITDVGRGEKSMRKVEFLFFLSFFWGGGGELIRLFNEGGFFSLGVEFAEEIACIFGHRKRGWWDPP